MTDDLQSQARLSQARFAELKRLTKRSQRIGLILVGVLVVTTAISLSAISAWNTTQLRQLTRDTRDMVRNELPHAAALEVEKKIREREREFGVASVQCLLEQLGELRRHTALAHQADADIHGYSYPLPIDEQPPLVSDKPTVCAKFVMKELPAPAGK